MRSISLEPITTVTGHIGYNLLIDGKATVVQWTPEAERDLKELHGLDIKVEIMRATLKQPEHCNLSEEERMEIMRLMSTTKE